MFFGMEKRSCRKVPCLPLGRDPGPHHGNPVRLRRMGFFVFWDGKESCRKVPCLPLGRDPGPHHYNKRKPTISVGFFGK